MNERRAVVMVMMIMRYCEQNDEMSVEMSVASRAPSRATDENDAAGQLATALQQLLHSHCRLLAAHLTRVHLQQTIALCPTTGRQLLTKYMQQ